MRRTSLLFALLCLILLCAQTALADSLTDAKAATTRGDHSAALSILKPLAERGNAEAQFQLGLLSAQGQGVPQNIAEAAKWFRKAAEQGYAPAQINLGYMYDTGQGVAKNQAEAASWWKKAADQGNDEAKALFRKAQLNGHAPMQQTADSKQTPRPAPAPAQAGPIEDADAAYERGDSETSIKLLRPLAEQGDMQAQYQIGFRYSVGQGVPQDMNEAVAWWTKAANNGLVALQVPLAMLYLQGKVIKQDIPEAKKWLTAAANSGSCHVHLQLAMLLAGTVECRDMVRAYFWTEAAMTSDCEPIALKLQEQFAQQMTPDQIAKAQQMARECKPKAAQQP